MCRKPNTRLISALVVALLLVVANHGPAFSAPFTLPDGVVVSTPATFDELVGKVEKAVANAGLGVVALASASRGAASRGVTIPGNAVVMVFRNDIAVRLLKANVAAGFEAPLRIYITENADGTASLSYRKPSVVLAPYTGDEVKAIARELDVAFEKIGAEVASR